MRRSLRVLLAAVLVTAASATAQTSSEQQPAVAAPAAAGSAPPASTAPAPQTRPEVPLPPPPPGTRAIPRPHAPPAAPAASAEDATIAAAAAAAAAEAAATSGATSAPSTLAPAPAPTSAGGSASSGTPLPSAAQPGQKPTSAVPFSTGGNAPEVTFTPGKSGGGGITVTQDLESDRLRMAWAQSGGVLPAFEGNLGMIFLYKDLSKDAGAGAYMSGVGFSAGLRVAILTLEPPDYAKRDTSWTAWKLGVGGDLGVTSVTINLPTYRVGGVTYGGPQTASMTSTTVSGLIGFMHAMGSFSSATDWSGIAIGLDWAPSQMQTVMTDQNGNSTTSASFNARAFAVNFESGSLQSMASKMGKKAKIKVSIFFLPPAGDLPLFVSTTIGAVWY